MEMVPPQTEEGKSGTMDEENLPTGESSKVSLKTDQSTTDNATDEAVILAQESQGDFEQTEGERTFLRAPPGLKLPVDSTNENLISQYSFATYSGGMTFLRLMKEDTVG
jgi:hypothetical protein